MHEMFQILSDIITVTGWMPGPTLIVYHNQTVVNNQLSTVSSGMVTPA